MDGVDSRQRLEGGVCYPVLPEAIFLEGDAAGVADIVKNDDGKVVLGEDGKPIMRARYTGLHSLRHFFASWCINRKVDGGLELPAKVVQERLGHSTVVLTLDRYGHLFPRGDDTAELAAAEAKLFG
jgi:integrase